MSLNTVPFNPFPPSSDQKGSGGGSSYVLPAATAETLGGIKVGYNLTVEEDGTLNAAEPYTLPIAEDNTLGGVKVGSGLSIDSETGALSADSQMVDYSTTEQATGQKWIDGKEIYKKVVNFGALPNNTTKTVSSGLTNETIIEMNAFANAPTIGTCIPNPTSNNRNAQMYYNYTNHEIVILTADDYSDYNCHIVLYYTKTETEE